MTSAKPTRVTVVGGSNTAGGWEPLPMQYPQQLAVELNAIGGTTYEVEHMGHGATDTLWAAAMFTSLVSEDTDVIVWEYALNDIGEARLAASSETPFDLHQWSRHAAATLSLFLLQADLHPRRPDVVLAYLWDWPWLKTQPPPPNQAPPHARASGRLFQVDGYS